MVKVTSKTKFMNSKRRAIFESKGSKGKISYFSMGENGVRRYAPKARFHMNAEGKVRTVKPTNVVPAKLRLASMNVPRKVRSNKGVKRGPRRVPSPKLAKPSSPLTAGAQMLLRMNAKKRRPVTRSMTRKA